MANATFLDLTIHVLQIALFLVVLFALNRRIFSVSNGYVPVTSGGFLPLSSYNVLPMLFLAATVMGIYVGDEFSLFGEAILLAVTLAMMLMVGTSEDPDPLSKVLGWVAAALSFTTLGLVFAREFFGA